MSHIVDIVDALPENEKTVEYVKSKLALEFQKRQSTSENPRLNAFVFKKKKEEKKRTCYVSGDAHPYSTIAQRTRVRGIEGRGRYTKQAAEASRSSEQVLADEDSANSEGRVLTGAAIAVMSYVAEAQESTKKPVKVNKARRRMQYLALQYLALI